MHLLLAPLLAGIVLVEAGEVAIVALVQGLVRDGRQIRLADLVEDQLAGVLRPHQRRGEGDVELQAARLQFWPAALASSMPCSVRSGRASR